MRRGSACRSQWHSPRDSGDRVCMCADTAPALSPKMVTRLGSPPKTVMLSRTQRSAMDWSLRPALPGAASVPTERNPAAQGSLRVTAHNRDNLNLVVS